MTIPKMPVFKKPEKRQLKSALNRRIRQVIVKLRDVLPKSANKEMLVRYLSIVYPGKEIDVTRLPFDTVDGATKHSDVTACLFAAVSYLMLCYWHYFLDHTDDPSELKKVLTDLEKVAQKGLGICSVEGDIRHGFRLGVK